MDWTYIGGGEWAPPERLPSASTDGWDNDMEIMMRSSNGTRTGYRPGGPKRIKTSPFIRKY